MSKNTKSSNEVAQRLRDYLQGDEPFSIVDVAMVCQDALDVIESLRSPPKTTTRMKIFGSMVESKRPTMDHLPSLDINTERTKAEWVEHFFRVTDFYISLSKWQDAREKELENALRGLYWDNVDYLTLNKLGGMNNHWMRAAREALGMDPNDIRPWKE